MTVFITKDEQADHWIMSSDDYDSDASLFTSLPIALHSLADNVAHFIDEDSPGLDIDINLKPDISRLDSARCKLS